MSEARIRAIEQATAFSAARPDREQPIGTGFFGEDAFTVRAIRSYLPKAAAAGLIETIQTGRPLEASLADDVAHGLKQWAIDRGASHFTHWFQPLTGGTAEKHDSFLEKNGDEAIFAFSAKNLIMGEPDASSFPSGGLRHTFEARGYTAWDPSSPAFIKRHPGGATLCIPTVFYAYTGEALDKKTPLLRSIQGLAAATRRLMARFGLPEERVMPTLGPEQEYFLIDKHFYVHRPDLLQTGRTLFGAAPAKHQQLEDHYFASIRQRVLNFMSDVENELWRLGVPAKTRHNEVAPAQFELAPIFEDLNLAVDHNMLTMEILRQTADRHGLVCLLHEKPFAGVNGSGKHNNWALSYGGRNLLDPGANPRQNAIFLTVLVGVIKAVDTYGDLLRMTVAGAGNDHRLGANEAPPAIISIYLGEELTAILEQLGQGQGLAAVGGDSYSQVGVDLLPPLPKDSTDRNRTSPFAFTGQKFEFRAPGSSQSCAGPMTVLNTIVAEAFNGLADKLESVKGDFNAGLEKVLAETVQAHRRIIFNGDGYSEQWRRQALSRGLTEAPDTMSALAALKEEKNLALLEKYGVYSRRELESRYEIFMEEYHRRVRIDGELSLEMARTMIKPVATESYARLAEALRSAGQGGLTAGLEALGHDLTALGELLDELDQGCRKLAAALPGCHEEIIDAAAGLRGVVDRLEQLAPDQAWPLPKYREMLFVY